MLYAPKRLVPRHGELDQDRRTETWSAPNELSRSVIEVCRAVAGFAASMMGLLICVSEFTNETSVSNAALSPYLEEGPMLNSKICRQHAAKCIETAEAIPPGAQREMFFDMASAGPSLQSTLRALRL
jgi:hypothetical protein